jgi:flagellar secretion chaperone FliS
METAYQQQALRSANGVELIIALYDGAIRFLYRAIQCVDENDEIGRRAAVKRVVDIIVYLQARLRTDIGGKPAAALADFYTAMFTMTLEASHVASHRQFDEVISCLRNVRDAWLVVARDPEAQKLLPRELRSQSERYTTSTSNPVSNTALGSDDFVPTNWSA